MTRNSTLRLSTKLAALLGVVHAVLIPGCSSKPSSVTMPSIDPAHAAEQAMEAYDKDGDGVLDPSELVVVPSLNAALKNRADADGDGKLSQQEIAARIQSWTAGGIAMVYVPLTVSYKGQPLAGANVTLIPEDFLGPNFASAKGVTDDGGLAMMSVADEDLPEENRGLGGMYMGFYKVHITHPTRQLPPSLNTESTIGLEIAGDYRMTGLSLALK